MLETPVFCLASAFFLWWVVRLREDLSTLQEEKQRLTGKLSRRKNNHEALRKAGWS